MKKKNFKNVCLNNILLIGIIIFVSTSCEKDNSSASIPEVYSIEKTILTFKNDLELHQTMDEINKMTNEEFNSWEAKKKFVSLRSKLDDVYKQINDEGLNNADAFYKIIEANNKWVELVIDEYGETCLYPKMQDKEYSSVLNTDGVCIVGENALKIMGDYKVTVPKESINELIRSTSLEEIRLNKKWEIYRYKYPISSLKSTNEYELRASYTSNPKGCNNDRRVFIQMVLIHDDYGAKNAISLRTRLTSERKQAIVCVWTHYWTSMEAKNVSCSAKCWSGQKEQYYSGSIAPFSMSSNGDDWSTQSTQELFRFDDNSLVNSTPEFITAHGEATSRGVGDNWAILNFP